MNLSERRDYARWQSGHRRTLCESFMRGAMAALGEVERAVESGMRLSDAMDHALTHIQALVDKEVRGLQALDQHLEMTREVQ